jgi:hypothetical protein
MRVAVAHIFFGFVVVLLVVDVGLMEFFSVVFSVVDLGFDAESAHYDLFFFFGCVFPDVVAGVVGGSGLFYCDGLFKRDFRKRAHALEQIRQMVQTLGIIL